MGFFGFFLLGIGFIGLVGRSFGFYAFVDVFYFLDRSRPRFNGPTRRPRSQAMMLIV